jgi:hypothetical protein
VASAGGGFPISGLGGSSPSGHQGGDAGGSEVKPWRKDGSQLMKEFLSSR